MRALFVSSVLAVVEQAQVVENNGCFGAIAKQVRRFLQLMRVTLQVEG